MATARKPRTPRVPAKPATLRAAVEASFAAAADRLTDADAGAQFLALSYADSIDSARVNASEDPGELTKALYMGPHLLNTLRALGCTPDGRPEAKPDPQTDPVAATLAALQAGARTPTKK